jgi:hypothetical protein
MITMMMIYGNCTNDVNNLVLDRRRRCHHQPGVQVDGLQRLDHDDDDDGFENRTPSHHLLNQKNGAFHQ